jgi:DNA mismatch endonuclease (patch repair protein)
MVDIYSNNKRSIIMSKISGKDTKPEIIVRRYLFLNGFRYRKNDNRYLGKPDIVLPKYKTIIFIHGCFWHKHNCKAGSFPKTRKEFWKKKIIQNKQRDKKNKRKLMAAGWKIITIWNCEINSKKRSEKRLNNLLKQINNI